MAITQEDSKYEKIKKGIEEANHAYKGRWNESPFENIELLLERISGRFTGKKVLTENVDAIRGDQSRDYVNDITREYTVEMAGTNFLSKEKISIAQAGNLTYMDQLDDSYSLAKGIFNYKFIPADLMNWGSRGGKHAEALEIHYGDKARFYHSKGYSVRGRSDSGGYMAFDKWRESHPYLELTGTNSGSSGWDGGNKYYGEGYVTATLVTNDYEILSAITGDSTNNTDNLKVPDDLGARARWAKAYLPFWMAYEYISASEALYGADSHKDRPHIIEWMNAGKPLYYSSEMNFDIYRNHPETIPKDIQFLEGLRTLPAKISVVVNNKLIATQKEIQQIGLSRVATVDRNENADSSSNSFIGDKGSLTDLEKGSLKIERAQIFSSLGNAFVDWVQNFPASHMNNQQSRINQEGGDGNAEDTSLTLAHNGVETSFKGAGQGWGTSGYTKAYELSDGTYRLGDQILPADSPALKDKEIVPRLSYLPGGRNYTPFVKPSSGGTGNQMESNATTTIEYDYNPVDDRGLNYGQSLQNDTDDLVLDRGSKKTREEANDTSFFK